MPIDLTLIGHGKMGQLVHQLAQERGHRIATYFNSQHPIDRGHFTESVCIDFTTPQAFSEHYPIIADCCTAAIVGTTGWEAIRPEVIAYFTKRNKTLIYGHNFSLGANIFFMLVASSAQLLAQLHQYDPYILEMHHRQKLDQPSGTALTLQKIVNDAGFPSAITPVAVRCGEIKGIHEVGYESSQDQLTIRHTAHTRLGFAEGALLAAEWSQEVQGVWDFRDLLRTKLAQLPSSSL